MPDPLSFINPTTCAAFSNLLYGSDHFSDSLGVLSGLFTPSSEIIVSFDFVGDPRTGGNAYIEYINTDVGTVLAPWWHSDISFANPGDPPYAWSGGDGWISDDPSEAGAWAAYGPYQEIGIRSDTPGPNYDILVNDGQLHHYEMTASFVGILNHVDPGNNHDLWLWDVIQSIDGDIACTHNNVLAGRTEHDSAFDYSVVNRIDFSQVLAWVDNVLITHSGGVLSHDFEDGLLDPFYPVTTAGTFEPAFEVRCPGPPPMGNSADGTIPLGAIKFRAFEGESGETSGQMRVDLSGDYTAGTPPDPFIIPGYGTQVFYDAAAVFQHTSPLDLGNVWVYFKIKIPQVTLDDVADWYGNTSDVGCCGFGGSQSSLGLSTYVWSRLVPGWNGSQHIWYADASFVQNDLEVVADVWNVVEWNYNAGVQSWYVNGDLVAPPFTSADVLDGINYIFGTINTGQLGTAGSGFPLIHDYYYYTDIRIGTTRGSSDIFGTTFSTLDFTDFTDAPLVLGMKSGPYNNPLVAIQALEGVEPPGDPVEGSIGLEFLKFRAKE